MTLLAILVLVAALCVVATLTAIPRICTGTVEWWFPSAFVVVAVALVAALVAVTYGFCTAVLWALGVLCGGAS